jgi:ribosomal protein S18 acetylase RimI-like enzyme
MNDDEVKELPPSNTDTAVRLRPTALPEDERFLFEVYASARADELAQVAWDEAQLDSFLKMQFNMQRRVYRDADQQIILIKDRPAGRLIVVRTEEEIRLADISLLPEYRRAGAGTYLLTKLIREASGAGKPVRLQVEKSNEPAKRLYERLGFAVTGESGTHFQMECHPGI